MRGPKFIVLHIRQLIKFGALALAGLLIIILLVWVLSPKERPVSGQLTQTDEPADADTLYNAGVYHSYIILDSKALGVSVTVSGEKITDINLNDMDEGQALLYPLFAPVMETLSDAILRYQTTSVEPPLECRQTGLILLEAINIALSQAYSNVITTGL